MELLRGNQKDRLLVPAHLGATPLQLEAFRVATGPEAHAVCLVLALPVAYASSWGAGFSMPLVCVIRALSECLGSASSSSLVHGMGSMESTCIYDKPRCVWRLCIEHPTQDALPLAVDFSWTAALWLCDGAMEHGSSPEMSVLSVLGIGARLTSSSIEVAPFRLSAWSFSEETIPGMTLACSLVGAFDTMPVESGPCLSGLHSECGQYEIERDPRQNVTSVGVVIPSTSGFRVDYVGEEEFDVVQTGGEGVGVVLWMRKGQLRENSTVPRKRAGILEGLIVSAAMCRRLLSLVVHAAGVISGKKLRGDAMLHVPQQLDEVTGRLEVLH